MEQVRSETTEPEHYHYCVSCGSGWGCNDELCEVKEQFCLRAMRDWRLCPIHEERED